MFLNDAQRELQKKVWFRAKNSAKNNFLPLRLETSLAWKFLFLCSFLKKYPWTFKKIQFSTSYEHKEWAKNKKLGDRRVKSWPNVATKQLQSHKKKYNKNIETLLAKQFFPFYLTQAAKIYVATSHSVVRLETIEISEQRPAFIWTFAQEVDWCIKDCDKQRLHTTAFINVWKIFPGCTGDWFDVKTASTCTTELWDALKSFILDSLKIKVAPYSKAVSLDNMNNMNKLRAQPKALRAEAWKRYQSSLPELAHGIGDARSRPELRGAAVGDQATLALSAERWKVESVGWRRECP